MIIEIVWLHMKRIVEGLEKEIPCDDTGGRHNVLDLKRNVKLMTI